MASNNTSMNSSFDGDYEDYYALLNVPTTATAEDVNKAFKRMSRIYHPDRHADPELKEKANHHFDRIRQAYEILSSPDKRAIYDAVGPGGLALTGWEVSRLEGLTAADIRAEYDRLKALHEEQLLRQNVNPSGSLTLAVNARSLFVPSLGAALKDPQAQPPYLELSQVSLAQSTEATLTASDRASAAVATSVANGVGQASLSLAWKRLVSPMAWTQVEGTLADGRINPGLVASVSHQLDRQLTGTLTAKLGLQNAVITNLTYDDNNHRRAILAVVIGVPATYLSSSLIYLYNERESHLKLTNKFGPVLGLITELGWDGKLSDYNRAGAAFRINWTRGTLRLKLKFQRASQALAVSIDVCDSAECLPAAWMATVAVPLAGVGLLNLLIQTLVPKRSAESAEAARLRAEAVAAKRREAESAVELMRETAARIRAEEEAHSGLLIHSAVYGRLADSEACVDVAVPLQILVQDSKLIVHEARKSSLSGFYDPCPGEEKQLLVRYYFHGALHSVVIEDDQPLLIPKQCMKGEPTPKL